MFDELTPVAEVLHWHCPYCTRDNMTAIRSKEKAGNQVVFECIFCGEESDVSCIDWSLQRSMHCPSCDGDGVIQGPDDLEPCKLCKWSDNELAYLPGTQVIFIPTQAGTNALHDDCEHGVVTSVNSTNIFVRYIDDTGGFGSTSKMSPRNRLHLYRFAPKVITDRMLKELGY